ncbi:MAG: SH3 domain-containing protein [Blautia sp.]|jgi:uncharacterized protein YgiM (DUF1202 family)
MKRNFLKKLTALSMAAVMTLTCYSPAMAAQTDFEAVEDTSMASLETISTAPSQFDILVGDALRAGTPFYIKVTAPSGLYVHRSPAEDASNRIGVLMYGETAQVISTERPWVKIYYHGVEGWIRATAEDGTELAETLQENPTSEVIKLENTEAKVINEEGLNVHSVAGLSYKVIAILPEGTVVKALAESQHWLNIEFRLNGTWVQGYVVKRYCKLYKGGYGPVPTTPGSDTEHFTAVDGYNVQVVTAGSTLNVRMSPSMRAGALCSLKTSTQATCLAQSENWYEISFREDGCLTQGYVAKQYCKLVKNYGNTRLSKKSLHMSIGEKSRLYILGIRNIDPVEITWRVNQAGKANISVNRNGLVTAKRVGKGIVAGYYYENGVRKKLMCVVTVNP